MDTRRYNEGDKYNHKVCGSLQVITNQLQYQKSIMNSVNQKIEAETHNCHEEESSFQFLLTTALFYHIKLIILCYDIWQN